MNIVPCFLKSPVRISVLKLNLSFYKHIMKRFAISPISFRSPSLADLNARFCKFWSPNFCWKTGQMCNDPNIIRRVRCLFCLWGWKSGTLPSLGNHVQRLPWEQNLRILFPWTPLQRWASSGGWRFIRWKRISCWPLLNPTLNPTLTCLQSPAPYWCLCVDTPDHVKPFLLVLPQLNPALQWPDTHISKQQPPPPI